MSENGNIRDIKSAIQDPSKKMVAVPGDMWRKLNEIASASMQTAVEFIDCPLHAGNRCTIVVFRGMSNMEDTRRHYAPEALAKIAKLMEMRAHSRMKDKPGIQLTPQTALEALKKVENEFQERMNKKDPLPAAAASLREAALSVETQMADRVTIDVAEPSSATQPGSITQVPEDVVTSSSDDKPKGS